MLMARADLTRGQYRQKGDPGSYADFFGFVLKSVLFVWILAAIWLGVGTVIKAGSVTSIFAAFGLGLTFGFFYALVVLAVATTVGWVLWRLCLASALPMWGAAALVSLLAALALAYSLSRFVVFSGAVGSSGTESFLTVMWVAARIAIVSVPVSLLVAWRTYGRLR